MVTEAVDVEGVDLVEQYADAIQIGARNMQNFSLLKRAGTREEAGASSSAGMSATLEEFLMSAEYILSEGNYQVILCERGVRTFSDFSRNTLDLAIVPAVKQHQPPADPGRPLPRHRAAREGGAPDPRGGRGGRGRPDDRGPPRPRTRRSPTARSPSPRTCSRS